MVVVDCGWLWVVVDGCGSLRMVVGGCGWLWVVAYFSITHLKLNFKFTSNSIPFENHFKFHFISAFYFKLTSKAFLFYFLF